MDKLTIHTMKLQIWTNQVLFQKITIDWHADMIAHMTFITGKIEYVQDFI
jgi:hypothetical protein